MGLDDSLARLKKNDTASAHIGDCDFDLDSVRIWKGRDDKWRLSGSVRSKSILDLVGKSMLGPNRDPAKVTITATAGEIQDTLHAHLTSSMETDSVVEITFTLLDC